MKTDFDRDLLAYFTDVEYLLDAFKDYVAAPMLVKRILVIHGVGGVGKSSLLRMFRLHCKSVKVPVAFASGDEQKSALDVLARWTKDLKADGVAFPSFGKTFAHYRAIQAKVDEQAKKAQDARERMADIARKAASKTAEAAGGALAGAAIGSVIPGIGTAVGGVVGGVLGGMGAEALVDWLRGFLKQPDIDLLLDPAKKLTDDFLADVEKAAGRRRIVLMLDTFEQMTALDDWARDVAQRLHANALLVIAGRAQPNWSRTWDSWQMHAQIEELKPMTEDDMCELVQRYYATMRGGEPNPAQVEAIIRFARGLPMVVTSAVQLWVKYGVEDFQSVKAEIVANLVDRLMEGVPSALIPALEAAAIVRWFDQPILRAVTGLADVRDVYNELRRFPFVRVRAEGLALHDAVREMMDENLRVQDSEWHCELHERAAAYFEKRLEKVTGEEAERLGLERLYHRVRADEEVGIKLFQEMAEELVRYRFINRLRALLNDVSAYSLERENSRLWREYYNARLAHLEGQATEAAKVYQVIGENEEVEPKLRAYALCDWGQPLRINRQLDFSILVFERGLSSFPLDSKLAAGLMELAVSYRRKGELEKSTFAFEKARDFYIQSGNRYGLVTALNRLKTHYLYHGLLKQAIYMREQEADEFALLTPQPLFLKAELLGRWAIYWAWYGQFSETEKNLRDTIDIANRLSRIDVDGEARDLGYVLGMQGKYEEAEKYFNQSFAISERYSGYFSQFGLSLGRSFRGAVLIRQGLLDEAEQELVQSLASKKEREDSVGIPEVAIWLGVLNEVKVTMGHADATFLTKADSYYRQCLDLRWTARYFFECAALTGLVRVKHAQGDYAAIPPLLAEAEQLAQQYEYNDHLASLRLTQGHIAWEGKAPSWDNGGDAAMRFYQLALIYALRYNRFLLDEMLSGRPQGTPLRPIIPHCFERGEEGRRMLAALRDWWKTGVNDIGMPRSDSISPIPEGIPLLEAEGMARDREPGDNSPQKSVVEQIEAVL